MSLGNDEEMRLRTRIDVLDGDEAAAFRTCSPSRRWQKRQSTTRRSSSVTPEARARTKLADGHHLVEQPRRVVVAVPARADRRARRPRRRPSTATGAHASCESARSWADGASSPLAERCPRRRSPCPAAASTERHAPSSRRPGQTRRVCSERTLVLGGKPTITSVVRLKSAAAPVGAVRRGGVAAAHRAQHAVVARLERDVQVGRNRRRLPQRAHRLFVDVVHLDRREPQSPEPGRRPASRTSRGRV